MNQTVMSLSKSADFPLNVQVAVPCEICPSGEPGQHYCTVCKDTLCNSCQLLHGKYHNVISRSEMGTVFENHSADLCRDHSGHIVMMQCQKCNILVCLQCVSDKHKGHEVIGIAKVYERERVALQEKLKEMEEQSLPSIIQAIASTSQNKDLYKEKMENINKRMEKELSEFKKEADKVHEQRIQQLDKLENANLSILDEMELKLRKKKSDFEDGIKEIKTLLASCSKAEVIMHSKDSCLNQQDDLETMIPEVPYFQPVDMNNVKLSDILGKLNMETVAKADIKTHITTATIVSSFRLGSEEGIPVCMTKEGFVWVGGFQSRKLNLLDVNGKIIRHRKLKNPPYCLAIMSNDDIIISPNVKGYSTVMRLRADDSKEIVYASRFGCYGVTVTSDQRILICTGDGRVLMYDRTGTEEIYKGMSDFIHAIELSNNTICISDSTSSSLLIIDRNGDVLRTITHPLGRKNFGPLGLAVDSRKNILATDSINHCVYLITPAYEVTEILQVWKPYWLSIDQYNKLWIGQENGCVTIVKYLQ